MAIVFSGKVLSMVLNDKVNTYYSDPALNAALGAGEKYYFEAKASNVTGTSPTLKVTLESSNDNVNWVVRSTPIAATSITGGAVLTGSELGTAAVGGRFARVGAFLGDSGSPNAYVEVWVAARNAF